MDQDVNESPKWARKLFRIPTLPGARQITNHNIPSGGKYGSHFTDEYIEAL